MDLPLDELKNQTLSKVQELVADQSAPDSSPRSVLAQNTDTDDPCCLNPKNPDR